MAAHSVGLLVAARVLQGAAVGAGIGALGAAMIDLQPGGSSLASVGTSAGSFVGLAAGALGTSLLAQYGPAPTKLIWWLLLGGLAAASAGILVMPEPGIRVGFGLAFLGAFRMVTALAPPAERAGLVAAIFVVNFLAVSIPALIAGWAVTHYGLHRTALVYCAVVAALAAAAAGSLIVPSHDSRTSSTASDRGE